MKNRFLLNELKFREKICRRHCIAVYSPAQSDIGNNQNHILSIVLDEGGVNVSATENDEG